MVGIVNYNIGNLASVLNALVKVGAKAQIEKEPSRLLQYDRLILPGVGAFGDAMEHLVQSGMKEAVLEFAKSGKPLLGICLGMQLLFEKSYEFGEHAGLGLLEGEIIPFDKTRMGEGYKIPQMGWNRFYAKKKSPLLKGLEEGFYLYYVHSFHAVAKREEDVLGESVYGYPFVSAIERDNVAGFQPHPEKSHDAGLRILKNFCEIG